MTGILSHTKRAFQRHPRSDPVTGIPSLFGTSPLELRFVAPCRMYEDLTNCTFQVALGVGCFWPDHVVDRFFMQIHQSYFHDCALTGRLIHDPPPSILAPFIAVPVLVTLLMTALVVWRSKRTKGVL